MTWQYLVGSRSNSPSNQESLAPEEQGKNCGSKCKGIIVVFHLSDMDLILLSKGYLNQSFCFEGETFEDQTLFKSTIDRLQYLSITRLDMAFAVNKLSQFMHKPTLLHWQYVKCLLRYLKHTLHFGLQIQRSSPTLLQAYSDANWGGCRDDRRSTSGFCIFLG